MTATRGGAYDYLVVIPDWLDPLRFASRPLAYGGAGFDDLLIDVGRVAQSVDPGKLSSCQVRLSNRPFYNTGTLSLISRILGENIYLELQPITVYEWHRGETSARVLFKGEIRAVEYDETEIVLECQEVRPRFSHICKEVVDVTAWPSAKPEHVGRPFPHVFNAAKDCAPPIVKWATYSRLAAEIDESSTADLALDSVEGFPSSGTVRIGREKISYTGVDAASNELTGITRGASSTTGAPHIAGSLVLLVTNFEVGLDTWGSSCAVTKAEAVDSDRQRYPLDLPASTPLSSTMRIARWTEAPTYFKPKGEAEAIGIELEDDGGSTATNPERARAREADYTESNYSTVSLAVGDEAWIATATRQQPDRGRIKKVVVSVSHSGTNPDLGTNQGLTEVMAAVIGAGTRPVIGTLSQTDTIDPDVAELAEMKGRRAVDQSGSSTSFTGVVVHPDGQTTGTGIATSGPVSGYPATNAFDSDTATALVVQPGGGASATKFTFTLASLPALLPSGATLNKVVAKCNHGGTSAVGAETSTLNSTIRLIRSGSTRAGPTSFAPSGSQTTESIQDASPPAVTVADLTNWSIEVDLGGTTAAGFRWNIWEVWFEIDYTDPNAESMTGSITNQFDATAELGTWEILSSTVIDIRERSSAGEWRLYHVGIIVIFEPLEERVPETVIIDVENTSITGDPATILFYWWILYAGRGLDEISIADVSAASTALYAAGWDEDTFAGMIQEREPIWDTIQKVADQSRLRVFSADGQLRLKYTELAASLTPSKTMLRSDMVGKPRAANRGIDEIKNDISIQFDWSDADGYRQTYTDIDSNSTTSYGRRTLAVDAPWIRDAALAELVGDLLIDRLPNPYPLWTFQLTLTNRDAISLADVIALNLGWASAAKAEVEDIEEGGDHIITVRARALTDD